MRKRLPPIDKSLFVFCTAGLHLSESGAYRRIEAARAATKIPSILPRLASGELTLTAIVLLAPHLTDANAEELLDAVRHQGKRTVARLLAERFPRPDVPTVIRRLPRAAPAMAADATRSVGEPVRGVGTKDGEPGQATGACAKQEATAMVRPAPAAQAQGAATGCAVHDGGSKGEAPGLLPSASEAGAPARTGGTESVPRSCWGAGRAPASASAPRALVEPLSPGRYKLQVTISAGTHDKLRQAQDLLRHVIPTGDVPAVLDRALTLLVADLERKKTAALKRPRPVTAGAVTERAAVGDSRADASEPEGEREGRGDRPTCAGAGSPPSKPKKQAPAGPARGDRAPERETHPDRRTGSAARSTRAGASSSGSERKENDRTGAAPGDPPRAERRPTRHRSRHIPAAVRREVWRRDQAQCAFVSKSGVRCQERGRLEYHHVVPFAAGGQATVANTALRCSRHNAHEADLDFGEPHRGRTPG